MIVASLVVWVLPFCNSVHYCDGLSFVILLPIVKKYDISYIFHFHLKRRNVSIYITRQTAMFFVVRFIQVIRYM